MANKKLSATITIGGALSSTLKFALGTTQSKLKDIGKEIGNLNRQQKLVGGIIQDRLKEGRAVDVLRSRYAALTTTVGRLRREQERLTSAQTRRERIGTVTAKMATIGAGMTAAGAVVGAPLVMGIKESKRYDTEKARVAALGFGDEESKKAIQYAKDMKAFGVNQVEKLGLMRDAMSVFGDEHHAEMVLPTLARMKFGNLSVFGQEKGGQNEQAFMDMLKVIETRGGLKSSDEFSKQANIIQRVISATGGKVGATEWRHFLMQAGIIGKGMSSEALFYGMEHLVQEMGGDRAGTGLGSLYQSLYQGTNKTRNVRNLEALGLIGDKSKVIHDKAGQTSKMNPGALLGSDLFRQDPFEWMDKVLLPQLAKKGVTEKQQVLDTFGMIASNSVGTRFLAQMYLDREVMRRKRQTNANAQNIDQLVDTGKQSAGGREIDAEAKLADAKLRMGSAILPLYTAALTKASDALEWFNKVTERHPVASKAMVIGLAAVAGVLTVGGPLLVGLAILPAAIGGVSTAFGILSAAALPLAAIGTAVVALGVGAYVVYKNWEPIKKFFLGLWDDVAHIFDGGIGRVMSKTATLFKYTTIPGLLYGGGMRDALHATFGSDKPDVVPARVTPGLSAPPGGRSAAPSTFPSVSMAAARGVAGATVNDNSQYTFHINQQPGQSADDLARAVTRILKQQAGVRGRSMMFDPASQ